MIKILIGVGIGLMIGWNILPQPSWIKNLYSRWTGGGDL